VEAREKKDPMPPRGFQREIREIVKKITSSLLTVFSAVADV
jgi:hypothetical protein